MIVNNGIKTIINRAFKSTPDYTVPSKFKVGIDQSAITISDTDLTKPVPITGTELADNCETVGNWTSSADGSDSLNSTTYKEGSGALNLIKAGTTAASVTYYNNNSMTSLDFTSKDLWVWLYIKDAATYAKLDTTNCLQLRYGIDYDTNYYYLNYDKVDLAVGWNALTMNTTTGTEQGAVTLNACDSGALVFTFTATSDTLAAGDVITDEWKLASSGDYELNIETGYPTINETTFEAENQYYLNSAEANGYNLTGVADFNTDSPDLMCSAYKFTSVSKSATDEVKFIFKRRLVRRW